MVDAFEILPSKLAQYALQNSNLYDSFIHCSFHESFHQQKGLSIYHLLTLCIRLKSTSNNLVYAGKPKFGKDRERVEFNVEDTPSSSSCYH